MPINTQRKEKPEISEIELKKVISEIKDRSSFLSTKRGASEIINGLEVRYLCKCYKNVIRDLENIKL